MRTAARWLGGTVAGQCMGVNGVIHFHVHCSLSTCNTAVDR